MDKDEKISELEARIETLESRIEACITTAYAMPDGIEFVKGSGTLSICLAPMVDARIAAAKESA